LLPVPSGCGAWNDFGAAVLLLVPLEHALKSNKSTADRRDAYEVVGGSAGADRQEGN
jgi:hypothetical protein